MRLTVAFLFPLLMVMTGCSDCNRVEAVSYSPDRSFKASLETGGHCGALDSAVTDILLQRSGTAILTKRRNVWSATGWHSIRLRWTDANSIEIRIPQTVPASHILRQEETWGEVRITYIPSAPDETSVQ